MCVCVCVALGVSAVCVWWPTYVVYVIEVVYAMDHIFAMRILHVVYAL